MDPAGLHPDVCAVQPPSFRNILLLAIPMLFDLVSVPFMSFMSLKRRESLTIALRSCSDSAGTEWRPITVLHRCIPWLHAHGVSAHESI